MLMHESVKSKLQNNMFITILFMLQRAHTHVYIHTCAHAGLRGHRIPRRIYKVLLVGKRISFLSFYPLVQFLTVSPICVLLLIKRVGVREGAVPHSEKS